MWQLLEPESHLPNLKGNALSNHFSKAASNDLRSLIGDCFSPQPGRRPKAAALAQRLLKEHNSRCAKAMFAESNSDMTHVSLMSVIEKCRASVHARRLDHHPPPVLEQKLSRDEALTLLHYEDSWDDDRPILGPEVSFLIGAGILWDLIELEFIENNENDDSSEVITLESGLDESNLILAIVKVNE